VSFCCYQAPFILIIDNQSSGLPKVTGVLKDVVGFLLGNSPAPEFYMPTFRNNLFHLHRRIDMKDD
jgi:hypothetical protein